ncbi:MAG TPA: NADH-ubiquinone oxidoreductase-F iron-sulfur binding region domain-containing protein [Kineosporiaceae bacterium]|nr:NADH-ubiquinone oxidoreductase-F iron-sulfur binding region domain-containing protein [Kineosporiaceae bacterium]
MTATAEPVADRAEGVAAPGGARLSGCATTELAEHARKLGALPRHERSGTLLDELERSGLTGRGGAAFPTWRKVAAVSRGRRAVVVANAAEGEPASGKDAALLTHVPHLVLDGLQLAATAVDARDVYLYVKAGTAADTVRRAITERRRAGWDALAVTVVEAPAGFVSGEESAVVSAIEGGPALPKFKRSLVVESGVKGRPTLVQNAETLAHVALIARFGADWFRAVGTPEQPGTFLSTVSGAVRAPGVVELPYGSTIAEVLDRAGGPSRPLRAVLVGGYHGAWIPGRDVARAPMSRDGLTPWGASPGAGVLVAIGDNECGLHTTARIVQYLADSSAKQCGPCMFGLPHLAHTFDRLAAAERDGRLPGQIEQLTALVENRGACHHPDGTIRLVRTALRTFSDDVQAHLAGYCLAARR